MVIVILETLAQVMAKNGLITAFVVVGILVWVSYFLSDKLTRGHVHGSAIAIAIGLVLAWVGGKYAGGTKGLADVSIFAGVGIMGGAMFRDFAIIATAFGAHIDELKKAGFVGAISVVVAAEETRSTAGSTSTCSEAWLLPGSWQKDLPGPWFSCLHLLKNSLQTQPIIYPNWPDFPSSWTRGEWTRPTAAPRSAFPAHPAYPP